MSKEKIIVVVDDDEFIRKTFFMILHRDYRVYLAKDAREALKRFHGVKVDLIIADMKLPQMNGLEMISRFRESGYEGDVILISAFPDMLDVEDLARLSIRRFFEKPLDLKALNQSIDELFSERDFQEKRLF